MQPNAKILSFAYGSNMWSPRLRDRVSSARAVSIGQLQRHRLHWHKRSLDGSGKCDAAVSNDPSDSVWGVLFEIDEPEKGRLDRAEGLGNGYDEKEVQVLTDRGVLNARMYFATTKDDSLQPYDWYRDLVVAGAREHGLPSAYVKELLEIAAVPDPDATRAAKNRELLKLRAARVRYIKLGEGGEWAEECIRDSTLRIGFWTETHFSLCAAGQWAELAQAYERQHLAKSTVTRFVNEVRAVYEDPGETLWITFHNLRLYWAFVDTSVPPWIAGTGHGSLRKTRGAWRSTDVNGNELMMVGLSGQLTKTASYRGTSCDVADPNYVTSRINGQQRPEVLDALRLAGELETTIIRMMRLLTPMDFELLVDLVFAGSGWRRMGTLGRTQKTVDMELELPSTGERAFVQVKSETTQGQFDDYCIGFGQAQLDKMFYVFHTGAVENTTRNVIVIGPERLARMVLQAGLVFWLTEKVA
jgi:hypothetical protein